MTTTADLIARTRDHLLTGKNDTLNVLISPMTPSDTVVNFTYAANGVAEGTMLNIGLEEMFVVAVSGLTATVIRGYGGSVATAHSAGALIRVQPHFSDKTIFKAINDCLTSTLAGHDLFTIRSTTFTYNPSVQGYNLALPGFIQPYQLSYDAPGPHRSWPQFQPHQYSINMDPDPTDFPGGYQLFMKEAASPGRTVRLTYKANYSPLVTLADDVEAVSGLHLQGHTIPPLCAALDLSAGRDVKRTLTRAQPEPRRAEEVPPGSASQAVELLVRRYYDAVKDYITYLHRRYPTRIY